MDVKTYIESGILELYVLGQLSHQEEKEVEDMQSKHIEIRREIHEISVGLEKYAQLKAIKAPASIGEKLFDNLPLKNPLSDLKVSDSASTNELKWNLLNILFALAAILGFTMFFIQESNHRDQIKQYEAEIKACDSITTQANYQYALLQQLNNPGNKIINMTPTANYAATAIYLHHNEVNKKNFLQLVNLPKLGTDQAFQLWSLKDGAAPMPLNVFEDKNTIIEVDFVDNTGTYAITIEPKGGSKAPNLNQLIGTMGVL